MDETIKPKIAWDDHVAILAVLDHLKAAGLCVCEKRYIQDDHLGLVTDPKYILGRIEEFAM